MKRVSARQIFGRLALATLLGASSLAPFAAHADDAPAGGALLLRMKFTQGEQRRYRFTSLTQLDMPGLPAQLASGMRISGEFGIQILAVNPDGSAKVKVVQGPMEVEPNISAFGASKGGASCEGTVSTTGKINLNSATCGNTPEVKLLERAVSGLRAVLPEKPVKPGDSWRMPVELDLPTTPGAPPGAKPNLRGDATLTFRKVEKVDGRNCAQIPMTGSLQLDSSGSKVVADLSATISGESCFDLDANDWAKAKMQMSMKLFIGMPGQGMQGTSSSTMEYIRLPDGPVGGGAGPTGGDAKPDEKAAEPAKPAEPPVPAKPAEPAPAPAPAP